MNDDSLARLTLGAGIAFLAAMVLASSMYDYVVSAEHLERLLIWRVLGAGGLLAALAGSYLLPRLRAWWLAAAAAVASAAVCIGAHILPSGFGYGIGGITLIGLVIAAVAPGARAAGLAAASALLGGAAVLIYAGATRYFAFSLAFFAVPAFVAAIAAGAATGLRGRLHLERDRELAKLRQDLERFGRTDELTGVPDRKQLERLARRELALARRRGVALSVIKLDVDGLEAIIEAHGRAVGDEALRAIASMCQGALRETDMLARIANGEFAAVVMDADTAGARTLCDRLRGKLQNAQLLAGDKLLEVTVNVGAATLAEGDKSVDDLLARADKALRDGQAPDGGDGAPDAAKA